MRYLSTLIFILLLGASAGAITIPTCGSESLISECSIAPTVIYVNTAASLGGDGQTWATAYKYLQDGIFKAAGSASSGAQIEIWVAKGTYLPDDDEGGLVTNNDRGASFSMRNYVQIYGGFIGGEMYLKDRNWVVNEAILSGNINNLNQDSDNSYHVISNASLGTTALISGFTISDGFADGTGIDEKGGAMYNAISSPIISHCIFHSNWAKSGGVFYNVLSDPQIDNCLMYENRLTGVGDGIVMYNNLSEPTLTNCTIADNIGTARSAFYNYSSIASVITLVNCILWNNGDEEITDMGQDTTILSSSIVDGGYPGENIIDEDPLFVNAINDDYNLQVCSPAVDEGATIINGSNVDLNGMPRIKNTHIDIGAIETNNIVYVDKDAAGAENGTSWANAFSTLQDALFELDINNSCGSIWVAEGTYYPDEGVAETNNDRNSSFKMLNDVELYGGFNGNESSLWSRDWENNTTTLSGHINENDPIGIKSNRAYHVVFNDRLFSNQLDESAILDGFKVQYGNADENVMGLRGTAGAGIFCFFSSPTIKNCELKYNDAVTLGGAIFMISSGPLISDCKFTYNSANLGGAIYQIGVVGAKHDNLFFSYNSASENGGAVYTAQSDSEFINCSFALNAAEENGGAIFNSSGIPSYINCIAYLNSSDQFGGAVSNANSLAEFRNCTISANTASGAVESGGAFYNTNSDIKILNSIVWGNGTEIVNDNMSIPLVKNSFVEGGYPGVTNSSANPRFLGSSYNLSSCSPALDFGNNTFNSSVNDLADNPRFVDATSQGQLREV